MHKVKLSTICVVYNEKRLRPHCVNPTERQILKITWTVTGGTFSHHLWSQNCRAVDKANETCKFHLQVKLASETVNISFAQKLLSCLFNSEMMSFFLLSLNAHTCGLSIICLIRLPLVSLVSEQLPHNLMLIALIAPHAIHAMKLSTCM